VKIFIDSANIKEIDKWLSMGVIDGVTTNPSIMFREGLYDIEQGTRKIAALINPLPLSVEVTTNDLGEMLKQGRQFAAWSPNIVVKIPQINQDGVPCFGVMRQLEKLNIRVNATVALSLGQVILSAKAGATYISIFAGRVMDEGGNASELIMNSVDILENSNFQSKIIVGSIRSVGDILAAAIAGAHIITIPPQYIDQMADHKYTRETVRQFIADANQAIEMMRSKKSK